jgi:hypothetical protein
MLYRLTTYHTTPDRFEALRGAREDRAWPRLREAGAVPLGLWRVLLGGRPGDVLELARFDSLAHWQAVTDGGVRDWSETLPEQELALRPLSRRHPGGEPAPTPGGGVWALRRMVPEAGAETRIARLSEEHVWPGFWAERQEAERTFTLGMFTAHVAETAELLMLTYYATLSEWEDTRARDRLAQSSEAGKRAAEALRERATLIKAGGVRLLWPLSRVAPTRASCVVDGG